MPLSQVLVALALCFVLSVHASDVASLNRVTFNGNVFANREGEGPDGWMVLFCLDWYEPCQKFQDTFVSTAAEFGGSSQDDLFSRTTRFAQVDCAVDKALCNSQDVDIYPAVVHYRRGGRAGEWSQSGRTPDKEAKSFTKWLQKQMQQLDKLVEVVAVADEGEGAVSATFSMGVSLPQAMPLLVAMAAGFLWIFRFGTEVWEGVQLVRETVQEPGAKKQAQPAEEAEMPPSPVAGCLPESWAKGGGIEL